MRRRSGYVAGMHISTSVRLKNNIPKIMSKWEQRALVEISASHFQESLALRNSLPEYLTQLVDALSKNIDRTHARIRQDKADSTRIGKKHGSERANAREYTMDQMILEYHILREVICDVLEEEFILTAIEREVIVCSIEQAVNDAATQFSETAKEYQEQLAHTLVHDLRNPLTTAKVCTQMLLRQLDDKEKSEKKIAQILKSIERIDSMIGDLLDASKNKVLIFQEMDLSILTESVVEESNLAYEGRFVFNSCGNCTGNWNESSLRRLIENLATNAAKYGTEKSVITLTLTQDNMSASLTVHNQGTPIPQEEQAILFHRFRRAKSAEKKTGWGLGLTVVQEIVEAHNGEIKVMSKDGIGTTFLIKLPKELPQNYEKN